MKENIENPIENFQNKLDEIEMWGYWKRFSRRLKTHKNGAAIEETAKEVADIMSDTAKNIKNSRSLEIQKRNIARFKIRHPIIMAVIIPNIVSIFLPVLLQKTGLPVVITSIIFIFMIPFIAIVDIIGIVKIFKIFNLKKLIKKYKSGDNCKKYTEHDVLNFIKHFNSASGANPALAESDSYWFAIILKKRFECPKILMNADGKYCIKINKEYYDVTGKIDERGCENK